VRDAGRFDYAPLFERDPRQRSVVEESKPLAEEHGDEVNVDLVKQPGGQILVRCVGTTPTSTSFPGAAFWAISSAAPIPSVTNVNGGSPWSTRGSRG